jgi:hypothetical protein
MLDAEEFARAERLASAANRSIWTWTLSSTAGTSGRSGWFKTEGHRQYLVAVFPFSFFLSSWGVVH